MTAAVLTAGQMTSGLASVAAAVDSYLIELPSAVGVGSDADLLAEIRGLEFASRRLASAWNALLPEVERRGLPGLVSATSTVAMLQAMLRLSPAHREAAGSGGAGPRSSGHSHRAGTAADPARDGCRGDGGCVVW